MVLACRVHSAHRNINKSTLSVCYHVDIRHIGPSFISFYGRVCHKSEKYSGSTRVCTIHLHFPTFKFTHLRNRSLASWRGGQESKLTLFTGQLSNFDSSILFCPPSYFPASAFNRFLFMAAECSRRPELLFMVTPAPRSWQLQLMFYNLLFVSVTLHGHLNRVE